MSWLYLVIAGCFEIFGVGSIKLFTTNCFCDWFKINWLEGERTLFGLLKDR